MRIFLLRPEPESPPDRLVLRACEVLRHSLILSARVGGVVSGRPVVLVAEPDVPYAVAVLKRAGIEAVTH
jgi:hypothetical protein